MKAREKIRRAKLESRGYTRHSVNVLCRVGRARRETSLAVSLHAHLDAVMTAAWLTR